MMEQSEAIQKAAELILAADYMIVGTGAGLSADSGLPVYIDTQKNQAYLNRNLTYADICTPNWVNDDPDTFYGFWGSSMAQFRAAVPHEGYHILRKWRDQHFSTPSDEFQRDLLRYPINPKTQLVKVTKPPGPFFVYTSNVDALHLKAGFHENEICEIHGNIETWQCAKVCSTEIWAAPTDFAFDVDPTTMLAHKEDEKEEIDFTKNNGFVSNHPRCKICGGDARPAVAMFGDFSCVIRKTLWTPWRSALEGELEYNRDQSLIILEIGCGTNVPSVRYMSENLINEFPTQSHIIRINRDFLESDYTKHPERIVGIKGGGRDILQAIDDVIQQKLAKPEKVKKTNFQLFAEKVKNGKKGLVGLLTTTTLS